MPVVSVEYDPEMRVWEDGLHVGAFIASAASLPEIAGIGSMEDRALGEFAAALEVVARRVTVEAGALYPRAQLLLAARAYDAAFLIDYLRGLVRPIALSSQYDLVLR
jgi:hypothetical protein